MRLPASWQVMENMRTVRLFGAEHRELARFQSQLDAEHRRTSRLALLQGAFLDNLSVKSIA